MDTEIVCMVCNKTTKQLTPAHLRTHGMTMAQYKERFPDAPILSEAARAKLSVERKGKARDPQIIAKMHAGRDAAPTRSGYTQSDETKRKIADKARGRTLSAEHRDKIAAAGRGKSHSEETKQKMRENHWMKKRSLTDNLPKPTIKVSQPQVVRPTARVDSPRTPVDIKPYLTEYSLTCWCIKSLRGDDLKYNRKVKSLPLPFRPDVSIESEKIVIEYDGHHHYQNPAVILGDIERDAAYASFGFRTIRVPFFLQLSNTTIAYWFDGLIKPGYDRIKQTYPHGFIDETAYLPASFCELGVRKFKVEFERLPKHIREDILLSIANKIGSGDPLLVLPPSLLKSFGW